jgi:hypothetical protein
MQIRHARMMLVLCLLGLLLAACGGASQPAAEPAAEGPELRGAAAGS